jgi:polysaccharide biosynthesis/export protein
MSDSSQIHSILALTALLLSACASAGGPPPRSPTPAEYRIGPEDLIEVVVWNNDTVSRKVPVRPDGMISLPLVNDVQAAGLTALELRGRLSNAFRSFMPNPEVFVIVQEINSPKVLVVGEVVHPGQYVIRGPTTVLDLVAQAGGLTEFAAGSKATLMRTVGGKTERYGVITQAEEAEGARLAVQVQSGDIVVVP